MTNAHFSQRWPLTRSQHWGHAIGTVLTGGLWGIVWAVHALRGNKTPPAGNPGEGMHSRRDFDPEAFRTMYRDSRDTA